MTVYYMYYSRNKKKHYIYKEHLSSYLMQSDYPLFSSIKACKEYWASEGIDLSNAEVW